MSSDSTEHRLPAGTASAPPVPVGPLHFKKESLVVFASCLLLLCLYFRDNVKYFFPIADNMCLLTESTPYCKPMDWGVWFWRGWHDLCRPYAEYAGTTQDFIRPVLNACSLCNYLVWGDRWGNYLYLNFVFMSAAAAAGYYISRRFLDWGTRYSGSRWLACLVSGMILLSPATKSAYYSPSYISQAILAFEAALAFVLILDKRVAWCIVVLFLALFTKESAVFMPPAAGLTYLMVCWRAGHHVPPLGTSGLVDGAPSTLGPGRGRDSRLKQVLTAGVISVVPLLCWTMARLAVFHGVLGQNHVTDGLTIKRFVMGWITFPLAWPLGLSGPTEPSNSIRALLYHQPEKFSVLPMLGLVMNLVASFAGLYAIYRALFDAAWRKQHQAALWIGLWTVLSLAMVVTLGLGVDNATYVFFFGIPLTCYVLRQAIRTRSLPVAALTVLFQVLLITPALAYVRPHFGVAAAQNPDEDRQVAKSLLAALVEAGKGHDRVYVLNDITIRNGTKQVAAFAGTKAEVVVLNNVNVPDAYPHESLKFSIGKVGPHRYRIKTTLPPPCELCFVATARRELLPSPDDKVSHRNKNISYEFPHAPPPRIGFLGTEHWGIGDELIITLSDDSNFAIVGYDPASGLYRAVELPE